MNKKKNATPLLLTIIGATSIVTGCGTSDPNAFNCGNDVSSCYAQLQQEHGLESVQQVVNDALGGQKYVDTKSLQQLACSTGHDVYYSAQPEDRFKESIVAAIGNDEYFLKRLYGYDQTSALKLELLDTFSGDYTAYPTGVQDANNYAKTRGITNLIAGKNPGFILYKSKDSYRQVTTDSMNALSNATYDTDEDASTVSNLSNMQTVKCEGS